MTHGNLESAEIMLRSSRRLYLQFLRKPTIPSEKKQAKAGQLLPLA
jgi:hypothetical protein